MKCFFFPLFSLFKQRTLVDSRQSYKSKKEKGRRGGDAVAGVTGAAAVVIMRLLLHCVYACVRTQRVCVCVCEFTLLSPDRRRGHPPLTLCQRREEEREREKQRERERLKPHNALHAAGLKSCRFISSCSEGLCVNTHTSYTQTECERDKHGRPGR